MLKKKLIAFLAVCAAALTMQLVAVAPAQAGSGSCAGEHVATLTHTNMYTGDVVARTGIYRSSSQFCAVTVKAGQYYGRLTRMHLVMYGGSHFQNDNGMFYYQAGPVRAPRPGCYGVDVVLWDGNGRQVANDQRGGILGNC